MYRKNKTLQCRDQQICSEYYTLYKEGMPIMLIYATLGNKYDLSEQRIREIVADGIK
jgi:hypothetical protein